MAERRQSIMLEKGFNQFMLNSGENQFRSEKHFKPGPGVNADLRKLAQATLQQGGVTIIGNMTFEAEKMSDCYVGMLFSNIKGVKIPLLITCGAKTEEAGKKIWSKFQKYYPEDKSVIAMRHRRPPAPFVTDFMPDNSMPPDMDSFRFFMSGISCDFCQCMGWAFLFPEVIDENEAISPEEELATQTEGQTSDSHDFTALINKWMKFGLDIKATAGRAEMIAEAVERMKMLGLPAEITSKFQADGQPDFSMKGGRQLPLTESEKKMIRKLESNDEYLVYALIRNDSCYGKMTSYIMVSRHKCNWGLEQNLLAENSTVLAYVHNSDVPRFSETGMLPVRCLSNGMLDRMDLGECSMENLVALADNEKKSMSIPPQLRPSQKGLSGIRKDNYPLPEELRRFNYFYPDSGHVVMAIPKSLLPQAIKSGNFDDFECPIPCRYILTMGYCFHSGYVVCDVPYSKEDGLVLNDCWYTW